MNKQEVGMILNLVKTSYPSFSKDVDQVNVFNVWYGFLQDYEFNFVSNNLKKYILSNKFPPTISDLVKEPVVESGRYVPGIEETRYLLDKQEQNKQLALNDPSLESVKNKAKEEIKKMLGIRG